MKVIFKYSTAKREAKAAAGSDLNKNAFLQILWQRETANQDPTNPQDSTQLM